MKRILMGLAVAAAFLAVGEQKASAWSKFGLLIGASINYEAADNAIAHGYLWRSGAHPFAQGGGYGGGGMDFGGYLPAPHASGDMAMPYAGMQMMPAAPASPAPQQLPSTIRTGVINAGYWVPVR